MGKAIVTLFVTLIVGIVFTAIGNDLLNGFAEMGSVFSVAVMGAMTTYFNEQKKK